MDKTEAWRIINACANWNSSRRSDSLIFKGIRTIEDDVFDAKRAALKQAWGIVSEKDSDDG